MSIKILTKNSIDNTNIDGARANHFSAGMRSGIVKGAYNEGRFFASASNIIALDTCELRISGHQVIIDSLEAITLSDRPVTPTKYSMIAEIQVSDSSVPSFRLFIQPANVVLRQENLFTTNTGSGTYQLRIGNFTLGTNGLITDVIRTADIITGGGNGSVADIVFNATATQLSSSSQPTANIDYNEETGEYDAHFGIPAGGGTDVTLGGIAQQQWPADFVEKEKTKSGENNSNPIIHNDDQVIQFAENERQKSKNLLPYPYYHSSGRVNGNITYTVNEDSSINVSGISNGNSSLFIFGNDVTLKAGTYTMSCIGDMTNLCVESGSSNNYFKFLNYGENVRTFTLTEDTTFSSIYISVNKSATPTINASNLYLQLEKNDEATDWVFPYGEIVHKEDVTVGYFNLYSQDHDSSQTIETTSTIVTHYTKQSLKNFIYDGNGYLTCRKAGIYYFNFSCYSTTDAKMYLRFDINGTTYHARLSNNGTYHALQGIVSLSNGSVVNMHMISGSGSSVVIRDINLVGFRIGE